MSDSKFKMNAPAPMNVIHKDQAVKPQKHRLVLKTLNLVPCEEYYAYQEKKQPKAEPQGQLRKPNSIPNPSYYESRFG